jgi:hypothetical protein
VCYSCGITAEQLRSKKNKNVVLSVTCLRRSLSCHATRCMFNCVRSKIVVASVVAFGFSVCLLNIRGFSVLEACSCRANEITKEGNLKAHNYDRMLPHFFFFTSCSGTPR